MPLLLITTEKSVRLPCVKYMQLSISQTAAACEHGVRRYGPGGVIGEMAQLAGRPALVDGYAQGPVEALVIPPDRVRALLVAEADLGERIMRALILRRVGMIEKGTGGPVIVARSARSLPHQSRGSAIHMDGHCPKESA